MACTTFVSYNTVLMLIPMNGLFLQRTILYYVQFCTCSDLCIPCQWDIPGVCVCRWASYKWCSLEIMVFIFKCRYEICVHWTLWIHNVLVWESYICAIHTYMKYGGGIHCNSKISIMCGPSFYCAIVKFCIQSDFCMHCICEMRSSQRTLNELLSKIHFLWHTKLGKNRTHLTPLKRLHIITSGMLTIVGLQSVFKPRACNFE